MSVIYTKLKKDAHCTDSDPLYTTQVYNAFDNVTGVSRKIEILATTPKEDIDATLEVVYDN